MLVIRRNFSISFADDHDDEAYQGREANFDIEVLDIKTRNLPEIDDDLAQEEGDYETLEEMRNALREQLQKSGRAAGENLILWKA